MLSSEKVVWITGASSGIGEALAQEWARQGVRLVLSSRREAELNRVKVSLPLSADKVLVLPLDLEKPETFDSLVNQVMACFGRLDIMVHNGGISQRAWVKDAPLDIDQKVMAINYFGAVGLTKAVLPIFLQQQTGHFVVISSLVGKFGTPLRSAYSASKHALHGFFQSLRAEVCRDHIRVTLVCPGYIKTNISFNAITADGNKHNQMDQNQERGIDTNICAKKIIKAVETNRQEVIIGGKERFGVYLKRFFPGLFSQIIRRMVPN